MKEFVKHWWGTFIVFCNWYLLFVGVPAVVYGVYQVGGLWAAFSAIVTMFVVGEVAYTKGESLKFK